MSLYHEAAEIIDLATRNGGSLKSIVFGRKGWKNDPKKLFALATEASKWSPVLSEIIEKSGLLKAEKQLTPKLALLLTHDVLLAKKGLALPLKHGLHIAITRHKARLSAELTKIRLSRGFANLDALKADVNAPRNSTDSKQIESGQSFNYRHPRWVRINTVRSSLEKQLASTFASYTRADSLLALTSSKANVFYVDDHIPNLIAVPLDLDITSSTAYERGEILLQDKASCFPAYLLDPSSVNGDIIDACAAPGNKTTHLAALVLASEETGNSTTNGRKIIPCERDIARSQTLVKMVKLAGVKDIVHVKANQDFLKLNPNSPEFQQVTAILLDPSCSGSGIVGRDEVTLNIQLPKAETPSAVDKKGRKRKRWEDAAITHQPIPNSTPVDDQDVEQTPIHHDSDKSKLQTRLSALCSFQLRLLEHAMAFPAAKRVTYSTCSVHKEENEHVVMKALMSDIATKRGWRMLYRAEQVDGLQKWRRRGSSEAVSDILRNHGATSTVFDPALVADACIRCEKGGEDCTMGFFVAGFVREPTTDGNGAAPTLISDVLYDGEFNEKATEDASEDEWNGFSDDDGS